MPKKTAPPPSTLFEACLLQEHTRHANRLVELRTVEGKLRLFEEFMPAIEAAGLRIELEAVRGWTRKDLYVRVGIMPTAAQSQKLIDTLVAAGMKETLRDTGPLHATVRLKKGRLTVVVLIDLSRLQAPSKATPA